MAKGRTITYELDVDERGAVQGARKVERSLDDVDRKAGTLDNTTSNLTSRLSSMGAVAAGAAAAGVGLALSQAMTRSIEKGREFEGQLAELEAITGITGDRLQRLGDRSLELSKQYGTAASDIVEANKLVASQLAEKIEFNTEEGFQQLQDISEQAIILQRAAGIDLQQAVGTTTSVINQFNLAAEESERVINTLAAGSKYGAAEVPAIGQALVNAGSAAASAGQSIETTNAAIQVLAANGQVGERAGTALRAIFTRLKTESQALAEAGIQNVNIEANGLTQTLHQLRPLLEDTAAAKKIFGEEALNQIQILIRNADSVESLTGKVTDTKVAHEQAATNMDTFDGAADRLSTTLDEKLISAFQETNGVGVQFLETLTEITEGVGDSISLMNDAIDRRERIANIAGSQGDTGFLDFGIDDELARTQAEEVLDKWENETQQTFGELEQIVNETSFFEEQASQIDSLNPKWMSYTSRILANKDALQETRDGLQAQADALRSQMAAVDADSDQYRIWRELLREVEARLNAANKAVESTTKSVNANTEAQQDSNEAGEEQEAKQETLAEKLKSKKDQLDQLIASEENLTGASWEQAKALQGEIVELEDLLELRKQYIQQAASFDGIGSVGADAVPEEQASGEDDLQTFGDQPEDQRIAAEQALQDQISKTKLAYDSVTEAATSGFEQQQQGLQLTAEEWEQVASQTGQAGAQAILYADTASEAIRGVIEGAINQIIALWVRNALQTAGASGPAALALSPILAAGAVKAAKALTKPLLDFERGGIPSGPSHAQGGMLGVIDGKPAFEFEGGEAIINRRSTRKFLPELNAINQAGGGVPLARDGALTLNGVNRNGGPIPGTSSGTDTAAIAAAVREGMEGATVVARLRDSIADLDEKLSNYREEQNLVGN